MIPIRRGVILPFIAVLGVSCSSSSSTSPATTSTPLFVFAASSLTKAFTQIGQDFHTAHPNVTVTFDFGSSTDLASQIQSEGTADVFASASGTAMDTLQSAPGVTDRTSFATNRLVIITPPDNPAGIASIDDLAGSDVKLVLAAEGVPVGDYARQALKSAGILAQATANVVSNEDDDASVVAKVTAGDADAAIVYTSDVASSGSSVRSVAIPSAVNVVATYPIAVVTGSTHTDAATAFLDYVVEPAGQATLKDFGFGPAG
ncbi:MAG: molybdate ABC transporter substrate-binding protein [Actinobacteria bacterium]|nr:MAG: molybdate ABC transporter substrate-binding protein [Actinomycetota bacterium]